MRTYFESVILCLSAIASQAVYAQWQIPLFDIVM